MISDDLRAFPRRKFTFTIKYGLCGEPYRCKGSSTTRNISLGGVYFNSVERLRIGEKIRCEILIPEQNDCIEYTARVVRCEKLQEKILATYGIAAEFSDNIRGEHVLRSVLEQC